MPMPMSMPVLFDDIAEGADDAAAEGDIDIGIVVDAISILISMLRAMIEEGLRAACRMRLSESKLLSK